MQSWKNTPREKALRQVIGAAVEYVVGKTPASFYRHGGQSQTVVQSLPATGEQVVITATSLNVRAGPGTSHSVQFSLVSGSIVDVLQRDAGWVHIRDDQGREGWVSADYTASLE